ncbi:hypothetical protein B0H17DRAFT_1202826 [Mycena rosella]|uniref:Uncharacterized protein n=1 Tax=Mycena rosella TaxID=1033263 RepID=A0AAD7DD87_MYCRO|nr:hypothetical protein B0H17DRAFT_1202826 [Mycena rosella]
MPPAKSPLWEFFLPGAKQNSSQYVAHCLGCIRHYQQVQNPLDDSDLALKARLVWGEATLEHAIASAVAEESDEEPDDGALSGSGDDFEL